MIISGLFIQFSQLDGKSKQWNCNLSINFENNNCEILDEIDTEDFDDSRSTYRFIAEIETKEEYEIFEIEFNRNKYGDFTVLKDTEFHNFLKFMEFLNLKNVLSEKEVKNKNNLKI